MVVIYQHTHTVFVNHVTFFCKILSTKNREVCKIRKRLILKLNEDFLYTFTYYYKK